MQRCTMDYYSASDLRPGRFVDALFQVRGMAKRIKSQGRDHIFLMILADDYGRFDAIAGKAAAGLTSGQVVHVCGCVLVLRGEPILVACSLRPVTSRDQTF